MERYSLMNSAFDDDRAIVLNGAHYDIGTRVIRWDHSGGFDGYTRKHVEFVEENRKTGRVKKKIINGPRYGKRTVWGKKSQIAKISQFFVHHSGGDGPTPANMYNTLYMRRKLSVHFSVTGSGIIYQFNDAIDNCWHAGKHNPISIGVECLLYPLAGQRPDYYSPSRVDRLGLVPHDVVDDVIHGRRMRVFAFPTAQVEALARLAAGTWEALNLQRRAFGISPLQDPRFPKVNHDVIPRTVYPNARQHVGLIGHLQCTRNKIDPAGFPWDDFELHVIHNYLTIKGVTP